MNISPNEVKKFGMLEYYLASSSATLLRVENGLSRIMPAIDGSRSACITAVIAPILRPHNPVINVKNRLRMKLYLLCSQLSILLNNPQ